MCIGELCQSASVLKNKYKGQAQDVLEQWLKYFESFLNKFQFYESTDQLMEFIAL